MLDKAIALVAKTFNVNPETLTARVGIGDVPGWDSLGHQTLILEAERKYGFTFTLMETMSVDSIATLRDVLERRMKNDDTDAGGTVS